MRVLLFVVVAVLGMAATSCGSDYTEYVSEYGTKAYVMQRDVKPASKFIASEYGIVRCSRIQEIDDGYIISYDIISSGKKLVVYYMDSQDGVITVEEE